MREFLDNLLPALRDNVWLQAATIIVVALIAAKVLDFLITRFLAVWAKRTDTDLDDRLIATLHRPIFVSVVLIGFWLAILRLPGDERLIGNGVKILKTIAVLMWATFASRAVAIVLEALGRLEGRASFVEPRTVALFKNVAKVILLGGAVYFLLLSWGIDVGGWMVSAGVLGLVLGLAAKDTLSNLFAGLFILADAPYKEGDFINLDSGDRGQVTKIGLRSTRLLTRDDIEITVPNAVIANAKIVNETGGPWKKERVRVKVGAGYGCDISHVRSVLVRIAADNEYVAEHPEPRVRLRALGDSGLQFELLCWIEEPVLRGRTLDSLYEAVYNRFREEGIEIPFPKRDVYLHRVAEGD
ncbi:MAG: mechanosensitive ion channel family protein [Acidobacteria bacterium]|nr:mechanosensitive ion channel family protein [Acidobacteriota bacterium]